MLSFFPRAVLDEIWDLVGSVSKGFPSYSWLSLVMYLMVSYLWYPFPQEMSWMRSRTELSQLLRIFVPAFGID